MTPLAIIAKEAGFEVTGSDIEDEFITDEPLKKAGITPFVGFSESHVKDFDLLITTGAHGGYDNVEVKEARARGIKVISKGEAVGVFMDGKIFDRKFLGISVAGSHGKTTATAMIATILKEANLDPSFLLGTGNVPSLGGPGHYGRGKYFVAEADEYATEPKYDKTPQFLWQHPKIAVFTNIELDHPDMYKDVDEVRDAFLKFANQLPADGVLVCCGDDLQIRKLLKDHSLTDKTGKVITYGFSKSSDFVLEKVRVSGTQTFFWVNSRGVSLGEFALNIPGEHNALNALGALVVVMEAGLSINKIKRGLAKFRGSKRRFEYLGKFKEAMVFDDYAHHPTEIEKTLKTFRQSFPKSKIVCIFQPHTYSRTKKLFEQFTRSFTNANLVILTDIFPSLREEKDDSVSSELLANNIARHHSNVLFLPKLSDVLEYIGQKDWGPDTVLLTMGAGDIYKIWKNLL